MKFFLFMLCGLLSSNVVAQETRYLYPDEPIVSPDTTHGYGGLVLIERTNAPFLRIYRPPKVQPVRGSVLICPGGGYSVLAIHHEGDDVAKWLASEGYLAMVLGYRLPKETGRKNFTYPLPIEDVLKGLNISRKILTEYNAPDDKLALMGFSAGGHLAAMGTCLAAPPDRPDATILMYPVVSFVEPHAHAGSRQALLGNRADQYAAYSPELLADTLHPPTLFVHATDDAGVPVANSLHYAARLQALGTSVGLYLPERGGHGFGMRRDLEWREVLLAWLGRMGW